ncbi:Pre-mRNA-splicing factor ATP-dependent RNA helicase prp22 [Astathelohania contejeani]|uniref:Pre-mRNA-splicing factor ATP-dependent RNA helicase prp22 n=1 Tax=Astathelohania contejeani TaxID=164912 RepID=A0ABQ7I1X0_9MICR|nr:Pre-mRNA-splicing factor ATP-dependent RNA helicase prp22 [Thelohania contejeani]
MDEVNKMRNLIKIRDFIISKLNIDDPTLPEYLYHLLSTNSLSELEDILTPDMINELKSIVTEETTLHKFNNKIKISVNAIDPPFLINTNFVDEDKENKILDEVVILKELDKDKILETIRNNDIIFIEADTGVGKSTLIPQFLLQEYRSVIVTQPRRIAAISIASHVSRKFGEEVGGLIGYKIRFDEKASKRTRLKYVTDGVLLQEITQKKTFYSDVVIIDEAHERSLNTDMLISLFVHKKNNIKIVIMSATLNSLEELILKCNTNKKCASIKVNNKKHKILNFYRKEEVIDYYKETLKTTIQICLSKKKGDILVFLTGREEIEEGAVILKKVVGKDALIIKLYSQIEKIDNLFIKSNKRKIILATNIAETSITIPDLEFVVDCGHVKQKRFLRGMDILETVRISQAEACQRSGRTGRTLPGTVYRIYSKKQFEEMPPEREAELKRCSLLDVLLRLKLLEIHDFFPFLEKPKKENIIDGLKKLFYLGALNEEGKITEIGRKMAKLPLEPHLAKVLLVSCELKCYVDISKIIAFMSVPHIFSSTRKNPLPSFCKGDPFYYLKIFNAWEKDGFSERYCNSNQLNYKNMVEIKKIHKQLLDIVENINYNATINENIIPAEFDPIIESLFAGYFFNLAQRVKGSYYLIGNDNLECNIHPMSVLRRCRPDKYVLFGELICTKKEFIKHCVFINPGLLKHICNKYTMGYYNMEFLSYLDSRGDEWRVSKRKKVVFNSDKFDVK